jgi:flavin reductase (DIM6/NTAB) family NADH-FMN oxidoreductase RutF
MINNVAMFKLSYGLFVLSANDGKDNACIINTVTQVTDQPKRVSIAVNKANYTCEMIDKTGKFTVSVLTEKLPFSIFDKLGLVSGRDVDKFQDFDDCKRTENGTVYITKYTNAYISCSVIEKIDCGTHLLFIADVIEADVLSDDPSVTYAYYFEHIKPKPQQKPKGYVCKICGYVHESDTLPEDFVCPWCKHGADDFEPIK